MPASYGCFNFRFNSFVSAQASFFSRWVSLQVRTDNNTVTIVTALAGGTLMA
jgi:hypothetical protein